MSRMIGFPSPFGGDDGDPFDGYDEFVPDRLPEPGEFLDGHGVLDGADHLAFHRLTRDCFEERTVYDMTFDYNLARLNVDTRHENAGFRYAVERDEALDGAEPGAAGLTEGTGDDLDRVLRAEFTPTTRFCPQTHTLTIGAFRAWNALSERHEYDLVRVRAAPTHQQSEAVNERLADLAETYLETGSVNADSGDGAGVEPSPAERSGAAGGRGTEEGEDSGSTDVPF